MYIRTCKYCGKEFESKTPGKQICNREHKRKCIICSKDFIVPNHRLGESNLNCCSKECTNIKRSNNIKKALKDKPEGWNRSNQVYERKCKLCGSSFTTNQYNKEVCDGIHFKKCSICGKEFEVSRNNLWLPTTTCSEKCRQELSHRTCIDKYGEEYYASTEKSRQNLKDKKTEITARRKATTKKKYGKEYYSQTDKWLKNNMNDPSKIDNLNKFIENPKKFIIENYINKPTIQMLSKDLGINDSSTGQRIKNYNLCDYIQLNFSSFETEICEFIYSLDTSIQIIHNDRTVIKPYELDLYLPEYNLAIECNPTSTHNSSIGTFGPTDEPKPRKYHQMKTDLCEEKGIFLFHIFGYEWTYKQEVIKSIISNLLNKNDNRIYARNTYIKELDSSTTRQFLDNNHRQGFSPSVIKLGLFDRENNLISVMTFSHLRTTIGKDVKYDKNKSWELARFCNLTNTTVVGGASKLFKHFINNYDCDYIRSYSDRSHTKGKLYEILGFKEVSKSDPGYVWIDTKTDKAYHRINAQRHNIKKFLKDDNLDLENYNERKMMVDHGFVQVFDSGTILWEWVR